MIDFLRDISYWFGFYRPADWETWREAVFIILMVETCFSLMNRQAGNTKEDGLFVRSFPFDRTSAYIAWWLTVIFGGIVPCVMIAVLKA